MDDLVGRCVGCLLDKVRGVPQLVNGQPVKFLAVIM